MTNLRILWAALLGSTAMYGVILVAFPNSAGPIDPQVVTALGVTAIALAAASQLIGRRLHNQALEALTPEGILIEEEPDPDAPGASFREAGPTKRRARSPEAARREAAVLYQRPMIVSCALAESVAIMGLTIGLAGGPRQIAFGLVALGAVLIGLLAPTLGRVFNPVEDKLGIRLREE